MAEVGGAWSWNRCYSLMVMTVAYIVGEVAHFLINTTGRAVAREIHFGESACFPGNESKVATNCTAVEEQEECESEGCSWDYSGLGLEYQVRLPKYTWYTSNAPPPLHCSGASRSCLCGRLLSLSRHLGDHLGQNGRPAASHPGELNQNQIWSKKGQQVLGIGTLVFSAALLGMGLATAYWHLVLCRMLIAAGEAVCR